MRIEDDKLLASFRWPSCEWCRAIGAVAAHWGCDPHHILSRGAGRVDIAENIVSLCRVCHGNNHAGNSPYPFDLLELAAKREGTTPEAIVAKVQKIRRTPKPLGWQDMTPAELVAYAMKQEAA